MAWSEEDFEQLKRQSASGRKPRTKARIGTEQRFFIPHMLPNMNQLIDARMRMARAKGKKSKKWNAYSEYMPTEAKTILFLCQLSWAIV